MTNTELLNQVISASGYKKTFVAKKIGLSYQGFLNKIYGKSEFLTSEVKCLCDLLGLTNEERDLIFFAGKVD